MICFPGNICSCNFEVSSNVSAHPAVLQYKIVLSVLSSRFFWKLLFFSLYTFSITEEFQNFSRCLDIHDRTLFLFNTNSISKIVPHYHVIIAKLNRMIVGNI